jgi:hypothetical protein
MSTQAWVEDCPTCDGRFHVVCRECGVTFHTIMRSHDGLCFDCTEVPA